MSLFQNSVVNKHLKGLEKAKLEEAWGKFEAHFLNHEIQNNIRESKEEQYQGEFLIDLFVNVLGYTKNPTPNFNLTTELKNIKDSKKSDGAILSDDKALAIIELKGTNTTDLGKVEAQAFGYKNNQTGCVYVITSNFEKLRFYIENAVDFEEFNLFQLTRERFELLWLCLSADTLLKNIPKRIKDESLFQEENITKQLYKDYSLYRNEIFDSIQKSNTNYDKLTLFKKTQKLLDRFLFIFFAEDRLLLPPNSIRAILKQWVDLKDKYDEYQPLYNRFKKYFGYMNTGYKGQKHDIFAYNGGLFAPDEILDNIIIEDEVLFKHTTTLSNYDFESEVSVNILGHIFEHSLNEIEEIQAEIEGIETDKSKSKRKKDGVFYTPKYITKYIVDNTVGKLCAEKKEALGIDDSEYEKERKGRKKATLKILLQKLEDYRTWLLQLTICDPACGSGAFLNQALEFLISEHRYIDELQAKLLGETFLLSDIENSILERNLFGVDINEESVEIAKLSLWLRTAQKGRKLTSLNDNIKCGNSLIDDPNIAFEKAFNWQEQFPQIFEKGGFDIVIGNPPYVQSHSIQKIEKEYYYKNFKTAEYQINLYSLFVEKSLKILKGNSHYGLIIPNYWVSTKYDSYFRKLIFLKYKVLTLVNTYEVFEGATVDTLVLIGKKEPECFPKETRLVSVSKSYKSILERLNAISLSNWEYDNIVKFKSINEEIEISFDRKFTLVGNQTLKDYFNFYKGMQPYEKGKGKPKQTREMMDEKVYHSNKQIDSSFQPLLKARNVKRYFQDDTSGFIKYGDNLAAPRSIEIFQGARILLNRILSKNHIDGLMLSETIINNSDIFNLIPRKGKEDFVKPLLPIIVSKLCATYFKKSNINLSRKAFPKINVNTLETFPIPQLDARSMEFFEDNCNLMIELNDSLNKITNAFLSHLEAKFNLKINSRNLSKWYLLNLAVFLKELQKQKIQFTLSEEAEWMQYFNEQKEKALTLKLEIDKTDREIDQMVYELYGLTEEEIEIVENSSN